MSLVVSANSGKEFEKPENGFFHAVLADVIDLGLVKTLFKGVEKEQPMVRFIWVLGVNGKDGQPLTVQQRFNANLHEKSNLYKTVKQILNTAPPPSMDLETLIGQTRQLLIERGKSADGTKEFANVAGIGPANVGTTVAIPANFVRAKDKQKTQASGAQQAVPQQNQQAQQTKPDVAF